MKIPHRILAPPGRISRPFALAGAPVFGVLLALAAAPAIADEPSQAVASPQPVQGGSDEATQSPVAPGGVGEAGEVVAKAEVAQQPQTPSTSGTESPAGPVATARETPNEAAAARKPATQAQAPTEAETRACKERAGKFGAAEAATRAGTSLGGLFGLIGHTTVWIAQMGTKAATAIAERQCR